MITNKRLSILKRMFEENQRKKIKTLYVTGKIFL